MDWEADVRDAKLKGMYNSKASGRGRCGGGGCGATGARDLLGGKPSPLLRRIGQSSPFYRLIQTRPPSPMRLPHLPRLDWYRYRGSLDADKLIFGSRDRYDIDVTQLWIEGPIGASWS